MTMTTFSDRRVCVFACCMTLCVLLSGGAHAQTSLTLIECEFDKAEGVFSHHLSADGKTVVGHVRMDGIARAFAWRKANGLKLLPEFEVGTFESVALACSAKGGVAVGYTVDRGDKRGNKQAAIWIGGNKPIRIANLDSSFAYECLAVSADGRTVAGHMNDSTGLNESAFVWTAEKGVLPLESTITLSGRTYGGESSVSAISQNGQVCAGSMSSNEIDFTNACVWVDRVGAPISPQEFKVGRLPAFISTRSSVTAVSTDNAGTVAGLTGRFENKNNGKVRGYHISNQVFSWLENPDGNILNYPNAISANANVVAGRGSGRGRDEMASYWSKNTGVVSLESQLSETDKKLGLKLTNCTGISSDGSTFAGTGTDAIGKKVSWLLTIRP